jgi:hypothetical protein
MQSIVILIHAQCYPQAIYAKRRYAEYLTECRSAECRYVECHGTFSDAVTLSKMTVSIITLSTNKKCDTLNNGTQYNSRCLCRGTVF